MNKKYSLLGLFVIFSFVFGNFTYADTNGVWHYASDIRSGTFGSDEGFGDFGFNNSNVTINNGNFHVLNGKVGIGTNSPFYTLDVAGNGRFTSNLYSLTLNTGHGNNELYAMDQNVRTTDSPTFAKINTGLGNMEVNTIANYEGNQNLKTTDSPTFANLNSIGTTKTNDIDIKNNKISSDGVSTLFYQSNHNTVTQMIFRDKQNTNYGRIVGSGNGVNFGLYDGDNQWSYLAVKDTQTQFRIDNNVIMTLKANGNVGIGTTNPTEKLQVDGDIKANNIYSNGDKVATEDYVDNNAGGGINYKACYDNDVYWYDSAGNRLAKDEECGNLVLGNSRPDCQNYNGGAYCGLCVYHSYDPKTYIYNDYAKWNNGYIKPFDAPAFGYDLTATDMLGFIAIDGHLYWRGNLKYSSTTYEICKSNGYAS